MTKLLVKERFLYKINWLWRLMMTGVCFVIFGVGGLLLSTVWFNLLNLFQQDQQKKQIIARHSISFCFRCFLRIARFLGVLDYHFENIQQLNTIKGCIIVANHPTLIDYVLLASILPDVDCLVKQALKKNYFLRGVVKAANYLINDESERLLASCRERLLLKENILIFPEGTRSSPNKPLFFQRGAANIAVRCACDVYVVQIYCSQNTLGKNDKWYHIPKAKPFFRITGKAFLSQHSFIADNDKQAIAARNLNQKLLKLLEMERHQFIGNYNGTTLY